MGLLVDTCVISELAKKKPFIKIKHWFESCDETLYLSAITVEEFLTGLRDLGSGAKMSYFTNMMNEQFKILDVTFGIAERSSLVRNESKKKGIQITIADGLIGATALVNQLTLVTRNVKDFKSFGVQLLNPF